MPDFVSAALEQLLLPMSDSFFKRVIFAVVFALVGNALYGRNGSRLLKALDTDRRKILREKTFHWGRYAQVIGFALLTGNGPGEGLAYTLPMALYSIEQTLWLQLVVYFSSLLLVAAVYRSIRFRWMGGRAVLFVWLGYWKNLGIGMLAGQGIEAVNRLIASFEPQNGSPLYFAFYAMILVQIFYVGKNLLYFAAGFLASIVGYENLSAVTALFDSFIPDESSGGDESFDGGAEKKSVFPDLLYGKDGNLYRLEHDSGDHATYYCPKTGARITRRDVDMET